MSTMNAEETKRWKAKNLRYKKPMVKELNLDTIREKLFDIQGECEEVRWYTDSEDGEDSLLNALDGNEDEVYEFKVAFVLTKVSGLFHIKSVSRKKNSRTKPKMIIHGSN